MPIQMLLSCPDGFFGVDQHILNGHAVLGNRIGLIGKRPPHLPLAHAFDHFRPDRVAPVIQQAPFDIQHDGGLFPAQAGVGLIDLHHFRYQDEIGSRRSLCFSGHDDRSEQAICHFPAVQAETFTDIGVIGQADSDIVSQAAIGIIQNEFDAIVEFPVFFRSK
jgi:hypothetical protein